MGSSLSPGAKGLAPLSKNPSATFLDLPAELRNVIYRLSLNKKDRNDVGVKWRGKPKRRLGQGEPISYFPELPPTPGILRTCKRIYAEASSILYGERASGMRRGDFLETVRRIPSFAAEVRFLELDFGKSRMDALSCPRKDSAPLQRVLGTLEALPKLRTLQIGGDFKLEYAEDINLVVKPIAQNIAKNLQPRVKSMIELQQGAGRNVREVLELSFGTSDPYLHSRVPRGSWRGQRYPTVGPHGPHFEVQLETIKEIIFQELESMSE